jgi:predicted DNA-binding protein (MmcQ/YjbR family)
VPDYADPPDELVAALRPICLGLPDAYEEQAWVGTRWMVRKKTFAHVLGVDATSVLTFRSAGEELDVLRNAGHPYFYAGWGRDVVGMVLEGDVDWAEVEELVTESFCVMAPKKLIALVDRPDDGT